MHELEMNPHAEDAVIKDPFVARYKELLGDRYDDFIHISKSFLRKGIRVNTLKCTPKELQTRLHDNWELTPVPWTPDGFWIRSKGEVRRLDVGNIPEHMLGYFYVQEPASMLPPLALDPQPGERVLDMCAAPGSKTSQIAMYMKNEGVLVANEMERSRLAALKANLQRCGIYNTIITHMDGRRLTGTYDRILVDAPCSGTGTIRKSLKTLSMWNPKMIKRLARIQLTLMERAYAMLESGGTLVYSTCTLEPEENEGVISNFLARHEDMTTVPMDLHIVRSPIVTSFGDQTYDERVKDTLRIYPMDNNSEGFYVAKLVKR